ncbi:MAG TPA: GTPase domain-containing protein [Lapillicoccus sp.]|nr:GTPase domain-containing protein [Lapillicoccus sp.]
MTVTAAPETQDLLPAVTSLRDEVGTTRLPFDLPGVANAESGRAELLRQLDDYILPRLASLDAPLLAVVGGSTGAGKSTLVNSLVGSVVSAPGVLRPTTRSPVLVHHPDDERWFTPARILPDLARASGATAVEGRATMQLITSSTLPPGLALLDAPDIDSVVLGNRALARQLLGAADLWLFVTTAARYADAVPWELLRQASERGTSVAVVLNRVPKGSIPVIREHLASMLKDQGLGAAPIFTVAESSLDDDGMLAPDEVARLHSWLSALAKDARARALVVRQTLTGALDSLEPRIQTLVDASAAQVAARNALEKAARTAYAEATTGVEGGMTDGSLLRGEVLARWQEFVGTGEFFRQVESTVARVRDRIVAGFKGEPTPSAHLDEALHTGVAELIRAEGQGAATTTSRSWRSLAGGSTLLQAHPDLTRISPEFDRSVSSLVHDWQGDVLELVRSEGKDRRTTAKITAYGVNAVGTVLMLVTFAYTGGITGAEVGIAGGTAVLGQKLLEAIFGDQAVRTMAAKAKEALLDRAEAAFALERDRFTAVLDAVELRADQARNLAAAAAAVRAAR